MSNLRLSIQAVSLKTAIMVFGVYHFTGWISLSSPIIVLLGFWSGIRRVTLKFRSASQVRNRKEKGSEKIAGYSRLRVYTWTIWGSELRIYVQTVRCWLIKMIVCVHNSKSKLKNWIFHGFNSSVIIYIFRILLHSFHDRKNGSFVKRYWR